MSEDIEAYLGDGLYARFDGWQIYLRTAREDGDHWVALEPEVLAALVRYVSSLRESFPGQQVAVWSALRASMERELKGLDIDDANNE